MEKIGLVGRRQTMERFVNKAKYFKMNAVYNSEPWLLLKVSGYVLPGPCEAEKSFG